MKRLLLAIALVGLLAGCSSWRHNEGGGGNSTSPNYNSGSETNTNNATEGGSMSQ